MQILYNVPMFFQASHLDTVREAGFRLLFPSISFTMASAITGSIIARLQSPALTLYISQGLLFFGTLGLVLMVTVFPLFNVSNWAYNSMLIAPIMGVGMIAPSTVLTLLNITPMEDQAVANTCLIMARSLGVFFATAISTTTVQNTLRIVISSYDYDESSQVVSGVTTASLWN